MKCPSCGAENEAGRNTCSRCGQALGNGMSKGTQMAVQNGSAAVFAFGRKARAARMTEVVDPDAILETRTYNAVIAGTLLWGLLVNVLLCQYSFLGYNMVVIPFGLVISMLVRAYAEIDPLIVRDAFLYTLLISVGMMALVMIRPQFFERIGGILMGALIGLVLCEGVLLILHIQQNIMNWLLAAVFSLYIGYDIYRSQNYPKTLDNAVDSALDIYMDIANLFVRVLQILGNSRRRN